MLRYLRGGIPVTKRADQQGGEPVRRRRTFVGSTTQRGSIVGVKIGKGQSEKIAVMMSVNRHHYPFVKSRSERRGKSVGILLKMSPNSIKQTLPNQIWWT